VAVSHGLIWRQETYLTYARVQDIHVRRNVFERWLGLGTVEIQTAAGSSSAEAEIVGVKEYDAIRNFLYARMRGHRLGLKLEEQPAGEQDVREVLAGIRDELRAIRTMLEARPDV
jgi:putative membrane protein